MPKPNTNPAGLKMVPLSLQIPAVAMATLEKAAEKKGFKPSHYAQMLFDAAFAVRVGIDKRQTPLDRELDEQVRLVFAHAGQGTPSAIARALGMPADRVERILAAWEHVAGGKVEPIEDPVDVDEDTDEDEAQEPVAEAEEAAPAPAPKPAVRAEKAPPAPAPVTHDIPAPKPSKTIGDLTGRQSLVFAEMVKRIEGGERILADEIAAATGMRWGDVNGAMNTLMGRALISRSAGKYVLTTRGLDLAAKHLLTQQAA